jgi:hypothetical protein
MAVVARIIPTHVIHTPAQRYMTMQQARDELKAVGIPEGVLDLLRPVDLRKVDPEQIVGGNPYDDPEADEEDMVDVTPTKEAAE